MLHLVFEPSSEQRTHRLGQAAFNHTRYRYHPPNTLSVPPSEHVIGTTLRTRYRYHPPNTLSATYKRRVLCSIDARSLCHTRCTLSRHRRLRGNTSGNWPSILQRTRNSHSLCKQIHTTQHRRRRNGVYSRWCALENVACDLVCV